MKTDRAPVTVAEALAMAEAWSERAAMLSTLAFELRTIFAPPSDGGAPAYLITRMSGGATPANTEIVEDVRAELFSAAEAARDEARRLLTAAADAPLDGHVHAVGNHAAVAPSVDYSQIRIPRGGYEVVANPLCPPGRRKLGDGPAACETGGESDEELDGVEADRGGDAGDTLQVREPQAVAPVTQLRPRKRRRT